MRASPTAFAVLMTGMGSDELMWEDWLRKSMKRSWTGDLTTALKIAGVFDEPLAFGSWRRLLWAKSTNRPGLAGASVVNWSAPALRSG